MVTAPIVMYIDRTYWNKRHEHVTYPKYDCKAHGSKYLKKFHNLIESGINSFVLVAIHVTYGREISINIVIKVISSIFGN